MSRADTMASPSVVTLGGKKRKLSPLTLQDYGTLDRTAVDHYRKSVLDSYRAGIDMLPAEDRTKIVQDKIEELAALDSSMLPTKVVEETYIDEKSGQQRTRKLRIDWVSWWSGYTVHGMMHLVWLSMVKDEPDITFEETCALFPLDDMDALTEVAQAITSMSRPASGNSKGSSQSNARKRRAKNRTN